MALEQAEPVHPVEKAEPVDKAEPAQPVVLVTGGGTGIGAASASRLADGGWKVAVCGRRREPLAEVARRCGGRAAVCDLADIGSVETMVGELVSELGRLDALVLNAGVMRPGGVAELDVAGFEEMVRVNLVGPYALVRAALPALLRARGSVVSVASVAALRAAADMAGYAATKAALTMLTTSLAVDHGPSGLRANVVCPGWTMTEMADEEMVAFGAGRGLSSEAAYRLVTSLVPSRRPATADEVAAVVAWLCSSDASYVNGAVIPVDGGSSAVDAGTVPFDPRVTVTGP